MARSAIITSEIRPRLLIDMSVYIRVGLDHVVGRGAWVGAAAQYALKCDGGQPMGAVIAIFGSSDSQCGVSLVPRAFAVANDGDWRQHEH